MISNRSAIGANANVTAQADWEALEALATGFQSGKASSAQVNKALRQASFITAALAQFVSNKSNSDVLDDGDLAGFIEKLTQGFTAQYLSRSNSFGDIAADGAQAIATALANLRLGDGSALPVGVPVPWPATTPPDGWLKCNGASFTASQYPKLASVYTSLKLPDLRGEFIRGWDDGRGVDSGRALISTQGDAILNIKGSATITSGPGLTYLQTRDFEGALTAASVTDIQPLTGFGASIASQLTGIYLDASMAVPTANENRPRNIAFNYIVRAA